MNEEKSEKISISLPTNLLAVIDDHEPNRSSYIKRLVTADLAAAGKLPGSPEADAQAEARELIAAIGPVEFRRLITLTRENAVATCFAATPAKAIRRADRSE